MTRVSNRLALAGLLVTLSCSGTDPVTVLGITYTLQGVVADAVTGQRIGGDLKLFLVQGPEIRGPSRLITGTSDPLMGEYAFTGVPVNFGGAAGGESTFTNNTWKVVAVRTGYQRFESEVTFTVSAAGNGTSTTFFENQYSMIGNIYLFPNGATAPDYTVQLTYNGKPVPGATVQLMPTITSNSETFAAGSALPANAGYVQSVAAPGPTDANGIVTFAGANLALGAAYKVQVLPVAFKEPTTGSTIQLAQNTSGPTLLAGFGGTDTIIPVALADLSPGGVTPLYITSATNRGQNQIQPNGNLVITFNIPVTLVNGDKFTANLTAGFKADGTTPGTAQLNTVQNVNATLSADGLTLTLAPNYTGTPAGSTGTPQAPGATDRGVSIDYNEGAALIIPKDYPSKTYSVVAPAAGAATLLTFADGTTTDTGVVVISGP